MNEILICAACGKEIKSYYGKKAEILLTKNPNSYFLCFRKDEFGRTKIMEKYITCVCHEKLIHEKCKFKHYGELFGIEEKKAKIIFEKLDNNITWDLMQILRSQGELGKIFVQKLIATFISRKDRKEDAVKKSIS